MKVVIVGGGAIGSSSAYHLATHPRFAGEIVVVERDPSYARASSALSASGIRQQFSTPVSIGMSQHGLAFIRAAGRDLAVDGDAPELGFKEHGYLFLASAAGVPALRGNVAVQRAAGAEIALLDAADLQARWPWLATEGLAAGAFGESGEGSFDGPALLQALRRKARALGVRYVAQECTGFVRDGAQVRGVRLGDGTALECDAAVIAAGAWSGRVAAMLDIAMPVVPRKRMVFVVACRSELPRCPLVIDASGIWFRREGALFLTGRSPAEDEPDPDEPPLTVEEDMFFDRIWPTLAARVPAFESLKLTSSWAGYYELNLFDHNGIVGRHPALENVVFAAGFSGHGMQHSPATGRGVAELIADGRFITLDLSPLGWQRVIENQPLWERNVV
ncbi:MAG: FAD-binding oxidoreductase [Alphaproteobacteria bacterium]|nr:FAD-binding oxidoreductase [Alphaproteobacteria bacterium]